VNAKLRVFFRYLVRLSVIAAALITIAFLIAPAIKQDRINRRQPQSLNNLRNVGLTVHAYATAQNGFVPAGGMKSDKEPRWSWTVQTLPFLESSPAYDRIHQEESWNSEANRRVGESVYEVFLVPGDPTVGTVDGFGVIHQAANSRLFGPRKGLRIDDIAEADGTAATILLGEIGSDYPPWIRPGNVRDPATGLGLRPDQFGRPDRGCNFIFVGGNGRYLAPNTDQQVMELLADPNNGVPSQDEF
jgi:hypothetical protein